MDYLKIVNERKKLGLSQEELADKIGVSQKSISKYERGTRRPSYETLIAMAKLFNVSVDYLLGTCDEPISEVTKHASQDEVGLITLYRSFTASGMSDDLQNSISEYFPGLFPSFSPEESKLLDSFRQLNEDNQDIVIGKTKELLREQRLETNVVVASVAADRPLKKASGK